MSSPSDPVHAPRDIIARYLAMKLRPVFWASDGDRKGPVEKDWQIRAAAGGYTLTDYHEVMRVGILNGTEIALGQFLHDVDIDWAEGAAIATALLPPTSFVFGRASKTVSHCLYTLAEALPSKPYTFKHPVDGEISFIELRGTNEDGTLGHQTMVPPSIWSKDGKREPLEFQRFDLPHFIADLKVLPHRVCYAAISMLLARYLGHHGFGHETRMAFAGFLLRAGVADDELLIMGNAILAHCKNNDVQDVRQAIASTAAGLKANEKKVTGGPVLASQLGTHGTLIIATINEWLGRERNSLLTAIERLNERFAIISVGNKVVVMDNLPDGSINKLWPFDEFRKLLSKERMTVKSETPTGRPTTKEVGLANLWLAHPDGRRYENLVYAMPGSAEQCGPDDYNGYLGFTVTPQAGDWSKNREHLFRIICRSDPVIFAWVINWMAALVQLPGAHAFAAIVLRGGQGTGKGHFAHQMLGALFYKQQYLHIIGAEQLTGQFNEHLSGKVLVFADESTWGGHPKAANKLKGLVTENTVPVERKFLAIVEEPSCLHLVVASNDEWPVSIPKDDRRYLVLDVADDERQNDAHFKPLREELAHGGLAAMLHDLLAHKIDESALRHPPGTAAKRDVMLQSLRPIERWWHEKLDTGWLIGKVDNGDGIYSSVIEGWATSIEKTLLHDDYLRWLDKLRETRTRRSTETELGMFLSKYARAQVRRTCWILPTLEGCRRLWDKMCGSSDFRWGDDEDDGLGL